MGKWLEHPKYNIISARVSDELFDRITETLPKGKSISSFVEECVREKLDGTNKTNQNNYTRFETTDNFQPV